MSAYPVGFIIPHSSLITHSMLQKPSFTDYFQLHFIVLIWGFTAILGKLLAPLDASAVVLFRTLLAVLGHGCRADGPSAEPAALSPADRWRLLATGGLIGLHWVMFFLAARLANVSVCLAGMATSSLWASVLEPLLLRRRVRPIEVVLGLVVMAGLYLIFRFEFDKVVGLAVAVFSAMLSSLFTIINSRFTQRYDALVISFYEMIGASVGALVLWLLVLLTDPLAAGPLYPVRTRIAPAMGLAACAIAGLYGVCLYRWR